MNESIVDAVKAGDAEAVGRLATPDTVNEPGEGGVTPLMLALHRDRRWRPNER